MIRKRAIAKCHVRAHLRTAAYRRRKARKFRTWTFSAEALFTRLMRNRRGQSEVLVRGGVTMASMPGWYTARADAASKSCARTDVRAHRYRRRKAHKFRTRTFSAEAFFTRLMREGRRVNCYAEVAKRASPPPSAGGQVPHVDFRPNAALSRTDCAARRRRGRRPGNPDAHRVAGGKLGMTQDFRSLTERAVESP
jgi:hypothetical protein